MEPAAAWFFAVALTGYEPFAADVEDVTWSVVEPEAPEASVSDEAVRLPVQPAGTLFVRSNVAAEQEPLLLFVTETVNATGVPAGTPGLVAGERLTAGLASVHGLATTYVAEAVAV